MKPLIAFLALLSIGVSTVTACPSYSPVYHNNVVTASVPYVSPVYPSVSTTTVTVHVDLAQYSAYLAPAIAVPYVQPPVPAAALIPQTPTVAIAAPAPVAAVAAVPVCPPAAMPAAPVAAAASEDFCKLVLARLDRIDAKQSAFEAQLRGGPQVAAPAPMPGAAAPAKATNLTTTCASCHGAVTPYHDAAGKLAPTFFDAAGVAKMTDTQIRKAIRQIKAQKMPPPDSAVAAKTTPDILNAVLDELDDLAAVEGKATVEPAPAPSPPPAPKPTPIPVPNP